MQQDGADRSLHVVRLDGTEVSAADLGPVLLAEQGLPLTNISPDGSTVIIETRPKRGEFGYTRFDPQTGAFRLIKNITMEQSLAGFFWMTLEW